MTNEKGTWKLGTAKITNPKECEDYTSKQYEHTRKLIQKAKQEGISEGRKEVQICDEIDCKKPAYLCLEHAEKYGCKQEPIMCPIHPTEIMNCCQKGKEEELQKLMGWLEENSTRDSDQNLIIDGYEFDKKKKEMGI